MRKAVVMLIAAAVLLPTGSPAAPQAARKWLGLSGTNFGELYIYDIYRKKSPTPDANGNAQYFWAVEASWKAEDGDRRVIDGSVLGKDFDTLGGCWTPSPENTNCARILIYRSGDRITGGYWKNCRDYCKSHHPFRGRKFSGLYRVGFHFKQQGPPDGAREARFQSGGAGAIVAERPSELESITGAVHGTRVFHVVDDPAGADLRTTIEVVNGKLVEGARRTMVELYGKVATSELPGCKAGALVQVDITEGDAGGGVPDRVDFSSTEQGCPISQRFTSSDPKRVNVRIDGPRETS